MKAGEMFKKLGYTRYDLKYRGGEWYQKEVDDLRRKNIKIYKNDEKVCIYGDMFPKQEYIPPNTFPTTSDVAFPVTLNRGELKVLCKRLKELGWLDE